MSGVNGRLLIGCVADDFTGASDAASFLVAEGINTMLFNGAPKAAGMVENCAAVVIALKTRNIEPREAVRETREAFRWLNGQGAKQFYLKYCSTFDSTQDGNIGPNIDSTLEDYQQRYTVICPALPVNRRVVKAGILYVDGVPLAESHMKNHPLNPMWASDIAKLMEPQGKYACLKINQELLAKPQAVIEQYVASFAQTHDRFYVVPDYVTEEDAEKIVTVFGNLKLLTGGSGLLAPLGRKHRREGSLPACRPIASGSKGRGIILAGSCSKATLGQIEDFIGQGGKAYKIEPARFMRGEATVDTIWRFVEDNPLDEVLVYSSDSEANVKENQKLGQVKVSAVLEGLVAELARRAVANGFTRIVVAGGETSGAVILGLALDGFIIGESIAPGVPVMIPAGRRELRLVLKSGNFGQRDFFSRALAMTRG